MQLFTLNRQTTGLLIIDVQEKLFPKIDRFEDLFQGLWRVISGFKVLNIPMIASEQYPEGLGSTLPQLKEHIGGDAPYLNKTTFSCMADKKCREKILSYSITHWVLVGIEAHVCVLQTAKDLLRNGKKVIVINDAIGSRSIYDFSSAIAELRDMGARVSSTETVLFELVHDSKEAEFQKISKLVQCSQCSC